jgi:hypothetical protein
MPTARSTATAALPPARMIDPRGHRFGAGLSAVLLVVSFVAGWVPGVALALASIGVSAAFGLRYSIYGAIWRRIVAAARLGRTEPEHEYPPRFAQTLGSVVLAASLLAFLLGAPAAGWVLALAVAGLQGVLAATGYCLGCRLYGLRWYAPGLFDRLIAVGSRDAAG